MRENEDFFVTDGQEMGEAYIESQSGEGVSMADRLRAEYDEDHSYHKQLLIRSEAYIAALAHLKAELKAIHKKVKSTFTDVGELCNDYARALYRFQVATDYKIPPSYLLDKITDKLCYVVENVYRKFEREEAAVRTPEEWRMLEELYIIQTHDISQYESALVKFKCIREICQKLARQAGKLKLREFDEKLEEANVSHFGRVEVTAENYDMFAESHRRKVKNAERFATCAAWDCGNTFVKLDGRDLYCSDACYDEQDAARDRYKKHGSFIPRVRNKRAELKGKDRKKYQVSLTDEMAALVDSNGTFRNDGKRKAPDMFADLNGTVKYYQELNKKQPVIVTRLDFYYPWSRKVTLRKLHDSLVKIMVKKVGKIRHFSREKCAS